MPMLASLIKGAPSLWPDCKWLLVVGDGSTLATVATLGIRITLGWQSLSPQPFFHEFSSAFAVKRSSDCPSSETWATHLVQPWRWSTYFTLWPSTCRTGVGREIIINNNCLNKIVDTFVIVCLTSHDPWTFFCLISQDQAQNIHKVVTEVYKDMIPNIMTDPEPWTWTQIKRCLSVSCMRPGTMARWLSFLSQG